MVGRLISWRGFACPLEELAAFRCGCYWCGVDVRAETAVTEPFERELDRLFPKKRSAPKKAAQAARVESISASVSDRQRGQGRMLSRYLPSNGVRTAAALYVVKLDTGAGGTGELNSYTATVSSPRPVGRGHSQRCEVHCGQVILLLDGGWYCPG